MQYNFGKFTVGGGYQNETDIGGASGVDRDSMSIGSKFTLTDKSSVSVQYATSSGDGDNSDASLFALSFDYTLDKNTTIYAAYATLDSEDNVQFSVNGKGHGDRVQPALGEDPSALSLGIVYNFDREILSR